MYKSNTSLAILLATYNSSKYLREQLDSLYNQTYTDWTLYVRDDGSKDDTIDIIGEYQSRYKNIVITKDNKGGLGAMKNFIALVDSVDAEYYIFCDHDDVWLPNKIELTIDAIKNGERLNPSKAVVAHTDLRVVDENLNLICDSMWRYAKIKPEILKQRNYAFASCYMTGCTMGFNKKAKKELVVGMPDNAIMHDWWIGVQAIYKSAVIISIPQQTIAYRIHSNQESSIPDVNTAHFLRRFIQLKFFNNDIYPFLKTFGYGLPMKYWFYKMLYNIRRNL